MKARTYKLNKVNVVTLGCSKNLYDSEVMMNQLKNNQFEVSHESSEYNQIVIINTCGFIDLAKQESIDTILNYAEEKKRKKIQKLIVTGCLSERYGEELKKEIKEIDAIFGTKELPQLLTFLKADYKKELLGNQLLTTPAHYAYLKISEGCNRKCSFCAIPLMRGMHQSVPIKELVNRAERLAQGGVKELILIAQELTFYGIDIYKKRSIHKLLEELSKIKGIEWIRLHYAYPTGFPKELIAAIRDIDKVCKYLDIPLQHISNDILKRMKRNTTKEQINRLIENLRTEIPDIALRTTLMLGFPGETQAHVQELKEWISQMQFDRLGVFTYSHEENTTAYKFEDRVSEEEKKRRAGDVMNLQQTISLEINKTKINRTFKVLFDRCENDYFIGRTMYDSPSVDNEVLVDVNRKKINLGEFSNVKITGATEFDLQGEVV